MGDESKLTRMSRALDNAVRLQSRSQRVREDAYKRVVESLEKAVSEEERSRKEVDEQLRLQSEADSFQRDLRRSIERQRLLVLQQQMLEKEQRRQLDKDWAQSLDCSYPDIPVTPYDIKRRFHREQQSELKAQLDRQILERGRLKEQAEQREQLMDQFRVEMAKLSLEKDLEAQREKRRMEQSVLVQSWTQHLHTQQLQRNVDRLTQFPLSFFAHPTDSQEETLPQVPEKEEDQPEDLLPTPMPTNPQPEPVVPAQPVVQTSDQPAPPPRPSALAQLVNSQRSQSKEPDRVSRVSHGRKSMLSNLSHSPVRSKREAASSRASSVSSHTVVLERLQELTQAEGDIQKEKARLLRVLNTTRRSTPLGQVTVKSLLQHDSSKQAQQIIAKVPSPPKPTKLPKAQTTNVGDFIKAAFA